MKKTLFILISLFIGFSVYAQSADVITEMLDSEQATFGQISYLAAVQKQLINDDGSYDAAVQALYDNGIIPDSEDPSAPIPLVDIVYIYSRLWQVKGGLMYRITKGSPRYAFKQFKADGIISANQEPTDYITGVKALSIYTSCLNKYGDFDMNSVSMESE